MLPSTTEVGQPLAIPELVRHFTDRWWASETTQPMWDRTYAPREQAANERELQRLMDRIAGEMDRPPRTPAERHATQERVTAAIAPLLRLLLDVNTSALTLDQPNHFGDVLAEFAREARRFDAALSPEDIFQAGRNAWTMLSLQHLLGVPVAFTPSILAYSLLYPYSDNYLDEAGISPSAKRAFSERFRQRLAGERVSPNNTREQKIFELVGLIEGQYPRALYPQVFDSLLAIHAAQTRSLQLHQHPEAISEAEVAALSFEKGGTSVLADGYLVAGSLTEPQQVFIFGYGIFAQLVDDLEDVIPDAAANRLTVYAQVASRERLDAVSNRTFHFGAAVLRDLEARHFPGLTPDLQATLPRAARLILGSLAGQVGHLYSRDYLQRLEAHSPFRFSWLAQRRTQLAGRLSPVRLVQLATLPLA